MLPLHTAFDPARRVPHDILMQNTIALVTFLLQSDGGYNVKQEYLGVMDGKMDVIGCTLAPMKV